MAKKTKSGKQVGQAAGGIDLTAVERLLVFMEKHHLEEFEYERDGIHIMLKKASGRSGSAPARASRTSAVELEESAPAPLSSPELPAKSTERKAETEDLHEIKSPIVGTFYSAASPDADPFVKLKARVDEGQVLCIIEAMKLMNEIEADVTGEVVKIFVENGHPVEYGQPLFAIRPLRK